MLWKERTTVKVQTYSQAHIDALVDGGEGVGWWHLIGFYGNPDTVKRPESWAQLRHLKGTSTLLWLTIGDFNEITGALEKEGGSNRLRQQMKNFIDTINFCGLRDLGFNGPKFTWIYHRVDGMQVKGKTGQSFGNTELGEYVSRGQNFPSFFLSIGSFTLSAPNGAKTEEKESLEDIQI